MDVSAGTTTAAAPAAAPAQEQAWNAYRAPAAPTVGPVQSTGLLNYYEDYAV